MSAGAGGLGFSLSDGQPPLAAGSAGVDPDDDPHHSFHHGMHMSVSPHHHHLGVGLVDCVATDAGGSGCGADREDSTGFLSVASASTVGNGAAMSVGNYCLGAGVTTGGATGASDGGDETGLDGMSTDGGDRGGLRSNDRSGASSSSAITAAARTAAAAAAAVVAASNHHHHHHHLQQHHHPPVELPYHHHHRRALPIDISAL
ncbi:uncharacterized transmembrane protein DDB_G0289901-like [Anopheles nili]|uniref:uncharacterized transmembrane protein DDB_G0289901-like n=1 Tax=Anopheles nili TaxID=185578 RepID=UPI00237A62F4|nr:uncharacterized transmembrane protein DDB_G0289901-like [Anopheles nili]